MPLSHLERTLEAYRQQVLDGERAQMRQMASRWLGVEERLAAQVELLARQAAELQANGKVVSSSQVYRLEHYQRLLAQTRTELNRYNQWAADLIEKKQAELAHLGIESAQEQIRASYRDAGILNAAFDLLPVGAVEAMIGMTGSGAPLRDLLDQGFPEMAGRLTQLLVNATASGQHPRQTAREMAKVMSGNLQRALTIARTEQLRAFRIASIEQMKASGVVEGWIWRAARQDRTCPACLAMDGTRHSLDEELNDHPQGRCIKQPILKGLEPIAVQSGREWFEAQNEATQRAILGAEKYAAWRAGKFDFGQLAQVQKSEVWGASVAVRSLMELLGNSLDRFDPIRVPEFTSGREAEEWIKKELGGKATVGNRADIGQIIAEALSGLKDQGLDLPKIVSEPEIFKALGKLTQPAFFGNEQVYINPNNPVWDNPEEAIAYLFEENWFSFNTPKGIIWHEAAHFYHRQRLSLVYDRMKLLFSEVELRIAEEVSTYAKYSPKEFVAEVFAGRLSGKTYSDAVNQLYDQYGGP